MYWSAAMSLKTPSRDKANYGSFRGAASRSNSLTSCGSSGNVRIPQSIPEHQCVLQFTSPRLQHYEEQKLAEYHELEQQATKPTATATTTTTVTVTASKALQLLLLASRKLDAYSSATSTTSSTDSSNGDESLSRSNAFVYTSIASPEDAPSSSHSARLASLNGSFASKTAQEMTAARAAGEDSDQLNYWVLERERLRAKRERRHLLAKHTAVADDDEPVSAWRTGAIMCSVPLVLVLIFALFVLLSGDGSAAGAAGSVAPSAWEFIVRTVTGETSAASSAEARHIALRGGAV